MFSRPPTTLAWRGAAILMFVVAGCHHPPVVTDAEAASERLACAFKPGMTARETLATDAPTGSQIPIDHVILIMQENRSFDEYYSVLPGVDGASPDVTNPDSHGNPVPRTHVTYKCNADNPDHGWGPMHAYYDGGKMDGFVFGQGDSIAGMNYYEGSDLPYYYALAQAFAISDRHFCDVMGPTWPNRMYYFAGTSWGDTESGNFAPAYAPNGQPYPSIFSELDAAKVSWRVYAQDVPTPGIVPSSLNDPQNFVLNTASTQLFVQDVQAGKLAQVTWIEVTDFGGPDEQDEGGPGDVELGELFVSTVVNALMNSEFWKSSVLFLSYDENGGYYDHVPPPPACPPDDIPPDVGGPYNFDQYGFRVPFFVVSPWVKRGYVSHVVTDHTSILRFLEARFDLPAMTNRDANATPPYDMFDFSHPDFSIPTLPTVTVDEAALKACGG